MRDPRALLLLLPLLAAVPAGGARRAAPAQAEPTPAAALPPEASLLAPGSHQVWIMDLRPPAEAESLMRQWLNALRADPQWYRAYSKEHSRPGEPLPYHPKMGMSQAQYERMVELAKQMHLTRIERAALTVTREGPTRVALHGGVALPDLTGIALDFAADRVTTPYGRLEGSEPMTVAEGAAAMPAWSGRAWRYDAFDEATGQGPAVVFYLGRFADGTPFLHYDAKRFVKGEVQSRAYHLLTFDTAGAAARGTAAPPPNGGGAP